MPSGNMPATSGVAEDQWYAAFQAIDKSERQERAKTEAALGELAGPKPPPHSWAARPESDIAHCLASEIEFGDQPLQGRSHEFLVGALSVYGM